MITLIGDTHGFEFDKIKNGLNSDYIIVLGDFGFTGKRLIKLNKILDESNTTLLFVDGNHEHYPKLKKCKTIEMFDGKVGKYANRIFWLKRGEVYNIENHKFLVFGGARSVDIHYQISNEDWYPDEEYNKEEYENLYKNIIKHNYKFDYILSHDGPYEIIKHIHLHDCEKTKTNTLLENIRKNCDFKHWYFGHHHIDKTMSKYTCLNLLKINL